MQPHTKRVLCIDPVIVQLGCLNHHAILLHMPRSALLILLPLVLLWVVLHRLLEIVVGCSVLDGSTTAGGLVLLVLELFLAFKVSFVEVVSETIERVLVDAVLVIFVVVTIT